MKTMFTFEAKSIALKWYFFTSNGFSVYAEFSHLFMKHLGFNPQQIGITSLFGAQHLFIPLIQYVGDKFQARKLVLWIATIVSVICFLLPLVPLVVSLPTCVEKPLLNTTKIMSPRSSAYSDGSAHSEYFKYDNQSTAQSWLKAFVPYMSFTFFEMIVSRSLVGLFTGIVFSLVNLATISYLGKQRANYGFYLMWTHVGISIGVFISAVIAWVTRMSICGNEGYGYFASFIVAATFGVLSMLSLPWFEFKYVTHDRTYWTELKSVMFNGHYACMYMLNFYLGLCVAFQVYWEFWYLDGLHASPLVMAGAALIRRPILAMSMFTSSYILKRIGDLKTVVASFLLFALSFFCISFTRVYWYVLAIDTLQAMGYGLAQSAFTVHFSKAGSEACSGVILGLQFMCFMFGIDAGSSTFGVLFQTIGTQKTMLVFSLTTVIITGILCFYLKFSKQVYKYEKLPDDNESEDRDDNSRDGGNSNQDNDYSD